MGDVGAAELLIIAIIWLIPTFTVNSVAGARGQSRRYALRRILGLLGLIIGLLVMIATPRPEERN